MRDQGEYTLTYSEDDHEDSPVRRQTRPMSDAGSSHDVDTFQKQARAKGSGRGSNHGRQHVLDEYAQVKVGNDSAVKNNAIPQSEGDSTKEISLTTPERAIVLAPFIALVSAFCER